MNTKTHKKVTKDQLENVVIDRKREYFQFNFQPFDFGNDLDDWWLVKTRVIDHTEKLNLDEESDLVEFIKYEPKNVLGMKEGTEYDENDVIELVDKTWNNLPFPNYQSPYEVEVIDIHSLKDISPRYREEYELIINNPYKVINHSTTNSLGLMRRECSEWKMECMWKGEKPMFDVDNN